MFEMNISRENLEEVKMFMDSKLVSVMNDYGLSIEEMALVLDALFAKIKELEEYFGDGD